MKKTGLGILESRLKRKDGEIIDALLCLSPFDPMDSAAGVTATVLDITERKRAEDEFSEKNRQLNETVLQLEQARNMLHLIIESIPVRVFWKDRDSRFLGCNSLFAQRCRLESYAAASGQRRLCYEVAQSRLNSIERTTAWSRSPASPR